MQGFNIKRYYFLTFSFNLFILLTPKSSLDYVWFENIQFLFIFSKLFYKILISLLYFLLF